MRVLGIAGAAKNTGKTTATAAIVSEWSDYSRLAVTSIGYDGESKDNVTGLPKPRLSLPAGALVVTAEQCLEAGSARLELLRKTDSVTPLGRLAVCRVRQAGLVVLAGPNHTAGLRRFIAELPNYGAGMLLVDGALGRLQPLAAADGLVLATGAARTQDIGKLARETAAFACLLSLPQTKSLTEPILQQNSLLVAADGADCARAAAGYKTIQFSGVVDVEPLEKFVEMSKSTPALVLTDPVKLLLNRDWLKTARLLERYRRLGGEIYVLNHLPLLAITINPFFPDYSPASYQYTPGFVDAIKLHRAISGSVSTPVVDVVRQGGGELARVLALG